MSIGVIKQSHEYWAVSHRSVWDINVIDLYSDLTEEEENSCVRYILSENNEDKC